ncbi:diadenosine tetraphosphate hydrolase [Sphingobacteriaceae bacterium GW460-11-11-14-LB5]|nr:diadenosine tetraphosphate hydrolase [Sphingobacteriaceae bacterium GW460-11-11-14-LB5]
MINFLDISYLQSGNERQQKAYQVLTDKQVLEKLSPYHPIVVGTIPINIDIENSDLDVICQVSNKDEFIVHVNTLFGNEKDFSISESTNFEAVKANFIIDGLEIELFGQNTPTKQQNAYCHMLIEHKLLLEKGEEFRQEIIALKKQGYKTEPAFAKLLEIEGDAYEALLKLDS